MRGRSWIVVTSLIVLVFACLPSPAHAAFPGQNGRVVFYALDRFDETPGGIFSANFDGTGLTRLTDDYGITPAWSPDGTKIAFSSPQFSSPQGANYDIYVMNSDGSGQVALTNDPSEDSFPTWSPDGARIAFTSGRDHPQTFNTEIYTMNADGSAETRVTDGPSNGHPAWSPDGAKIAFVSARIPRGIYLMNPDGSAPTFVTDGGEPNWLPDGSRIALSRAEHPPGCDYQTGAIWTVKPDGTGAARVTSGGCADIQADPAWSPDGHKFVTHATCGFMPDPDCPYGEIYRFSANGAFEQNITDSNFSGEVHPDWQPIPINGYPRPKGATPPKVSLVPAYAQCTSTNRTHGPPLAFGSCASPAQASDELTVGTADSNGRPTRSSGSVLYEALLGIPATPADEADVRLTVELSDIYEQGTLADYTGELRSRTSLRITDKLNTPHPGGPGAATVSDASLGATVPCAATADPNQGASCNLVTTFDALMPGAVTESKRSIWALGPAQLDDGGADNDADTLADNTLFMTQGVFVP